MTGKQRDVKKAQIGGRIRELRKKRNLSMDDLAKLIHSTSATVSNLENGLNMPGGDTLLRVSETLDISIDWLLTGNGSPQRLDEVHETQSKVIFFDNKLHFFCQFNESYLSSNEMKHLNDLMSIVQIAATCSKEDLQLLLSLTERIRKP